jgi:CheY-like chemotaxis protein
MPGIDGWETLRRIRTLAAQLMSQQSEAVWDVKVAIVSANAFDRGLDNALGIAPEDFIVKPVRHSELLDWLGRRLQLHWLETPPPQAAAAPAAPAPAVPTLPRSELEALQELVRLGFFKGILNKLEALTLAFPDSAAYTGALTTLARQYQFEAILTQLQKALDEPQTL